jgi:hypothetical protein
MLFWIRWQFFCLDVRITCMMMERNHRKGKCDTFWCKRWRAL